MVPPCSTTRPSSSTTTASARARTSSRSWVTTTAVRPVSRRELRSTCRSSAAASTSRAASGSSSSRSCGSGASARASATRCCCPPDSSRGRRSARCAAPTSSSRARAVCRAGPRPAPSARGPNATFSRTSRWGSSSGSWASSEILRRCGGTQCPAPATCRPATHTSPELGRSVPAARLTAVDLPAPLAPSSATTCPAGTSRSIRTPRSGTAARITMAGLGAVPVGPPPGAVRVVIAPPPSCRNRRARQVDAAPLPQPPPSGHPAEPLDASTRPNDAVLPAW